MDPVGLRGLWLRGRAGPARDAAIALLGALPTPRRKVPPGASDDELFGGVDIAATLAAGRVVRTAGLVAGAGVLVLPMAERCPGGLAARLGQVLDAGGPALVALDEGVGDESLPGGLADRLGLFLDLEGARAEAGDGSEWLSEVEAARARLAAVETPSGAIEDLARLAARLGIGSLRAPSLALAAARASAALFGRNRVEFDDMKLAVELVLAHRGLPLPETDAADETDPPPPAEAEDRDAAGEQTGELPSELLLEAAKAALPAGLLARLAAGRAARAARGASGTGAAKKGNRRGRPLPARPGRLDGTARIDLVATLRAAAPWQPLRRAESGTGRFLEVRPADIRVRRFEERSDRLLVFTVDASGSTAMARMAEAKGAIELLLGEAYARRDHVALVAFRGTGAEVLLPPTRSLVQTKRRLAGLPGGGGTPLAAGLQAAFEVSVQARGRGMTPTIALLTDGRANIALDGRADRAAAGEDAARMAGAIRASGMPALVIDTGIRPQDGLVRLAGTLDAIYLPLPRADAHRLSEAVGAALAD